MKTRRGKRSEAFWPSIVMKKWLNIKPKVHEFSEDEADLDTESEDDASSFKDEKTNVSKVCACRMPRDRYQSSIPTSGALPKSYPLRHRRGKSETYRGQYIYTKDVRITVGTWNVAGKPPSDDLEIDDWLCMNEPADMFILGFQEVVPLNAGNVLGAEDSRPIPRWEAIIRKTLNRTFEPETKHKSYSAPPSPVLRTSSAADVIAEEVETEALEMLHKESVRKTDGNDLKKDRLNKISVLRKSISLKRIYSIDTDNMFDWPEKSLDSTAQAFSSISKLRRVSSSSGRVGSWNDGLLLASPRYGFGSKGLTRRHQSIGNLGLLWSQPEEHPDVLDPLSDASDGSDDENSNSLIEAPETDYENGVLIENNTKPRKGYVRIVSKQMVGIYVSVWVRRRLRRHINNLKVSPVGVGLMGYMGNKGSVSVSMSLYQSRMCFVCSHLTSGHKEGDEQRRNSDVYEILRRTSFCSVFDADQPQTIPSHDQIFWFGDLNYRLNTSDAEVRKLVANKQWDLLIDSDQLSKELRSGHAFDGWKEGKINFPPTYKYAINSDTYVGENPKDGEKKRSPAWCDRILWLGKRIKQLSYMRTENRLSDHRPVTSKFAVEVEVLDQRKLERALKFTNLPVQTEIFLEDEGYEGDPLTDAKEDMGISLQQTKIVRSAKVFDHPLDDSAAITFSR